MRKLRVVLAGMLLTLPLFVVHAGAPADEGAGIEVQGTPSFTPWCVVYIGGKPYWYPC